MRRALPLLFVLAGLASLAACGATPPDYKNLETFSLSACGSTFTAAQIVHAAYDQKDLGSLPDPQTLPSGTLLAATEAKLAAVVTRDLPCALDATTTAAALKKDGYTDVTAAGSGPYLLLFKATDPYGIPGTYGVPKCSFVGPMKQNLTGGYTDQGLHGTFGPDVAPIVSVADAQTFAALTFRSQATQVADVSTLPPTVGGRPVFLAMDDAYKQRQFTSGGPDLDSLGLCAAWVVPNFYGGCDSVAVGISFTILVDDQGDFQQSPLTPSPTYIFQGYCGRTR